MSGERGRTPHTGVRKHELGGRENGARDRARGGGGGGGIGEALERSSRSFEKFTQPDPEIGEPKVPISCVARGQ